MVIQNSPISLKSVSCDISDQSIKFNQNSQTYFSMILLKDRQMDKTGGYTNASDYFTFIIGGGNECGKPTIQAMNRW